MLQNSYRILISYRHHTINIVHRMYFCQAYVEYMSHISGFILRPNLSSLCFLVYLCITKLLLKRSDIRYTKCIFICVVFYMCTQVSASSRIWSSLLLYHKIALCKQHVESLTDSPRHFLVREGILTSSPRRTASLLPPCA